MRLLLDTCAVIWAVADPGKLSPAARTALEQAENEVFVSPISCAELACLQERGCIELDCHWKTWFDHYLSLNGWQVVDISLAIVQEAYSLPAPFHPDPADRLIAATARRERLAVITGDRKLIDYPFVETL